jgi:hypothetical protein
VGERRRRRRRRLRHFVGPDRRSGEDLDRLLRTLLGNSSHDDAAIRVAEEIAAMPPVTDVALEVEAPELTDDATPTSVSDAARSRSASSDAARCQTDAAIGENPCLARRSHPAVRHGASGPERRVRDRRPSSA